MHSRTVCRKMMCLLIITCAVEHRHERVVQIQDDESRGGGLVVQVGHGLAEELVVEADEHVYRPIALLKGVCTRARGKASQWLETRHHHLPRAQLIYAPQVRPQLHHHRRYKRRQALKDITSKDAVN